MSSGSGKYEGLLEKCARLDPIPTAVAHPCEKTALAGALEAGEKGLITPILVGPEAKIRADRGLFRAGPRQRKDRGYTAQSGIRGEGGGTGSVRPGGTPHEGQSAHR